MEASRSANGARRFPMRAVKPIRIHGNLTVRDLAEEFGRAGVLGAGRFSKGYKIVSKMFCEKSFFNVLAVSGPLVPAGLRLIFKELIKNGLVHCFVSTGANVTHDLVEALGSRHFIGDSKADDALLKKRGVGRIYDIYVKNEAFENMEKAVHKILDKIPEENRGNLSTHSLLWTIGGEIKDEESIIRAAFQAKVPVVCPAIYDSMLGIALWTYSQVKKLIVNPFLDFSKLVNLCYEAEKVGAIILGGGLPKHYTLAASIFRGGVDAAVQITSDRPESGGLSGAPLEEAISWGKVAKAGNISTLIGDASILFPMLIASAVKDRPTT